MRAFALNVLLFLIFAMFVASPGRCAPAPADTEFATWALDRSNECDARWDRITLTIDAVPPDVHGRAAAALQRPSATERVTAVAELSHSVITTRSFFHKTSGKQQYLPLSTRERNGAARGVSTLKSPAKATLSVPYSVRRPLNSSLQQKEFFRDFGTSISRPKLNSFGRISTADHHRNGAVSRPTYRPARPRIL
jgi:hypothetical protein